MDRHELNRMFDALTPGPRQERELLNKLLQEDGVRRKRPMKNWKRVVLGAAAAALLVTGAAAATVTGVSQRLLAYLGVTPGDTRAAELLIPGAMEVDITTEDNGATFHVTQVLRDRSAIMVLADFTAPEGTSLWMGERDGKEPVYGGQGFYGADYHHYFMDEAGEEIDLGIYCNYEFGWEFLEDDDPMDNHVSAIFYVKMLHSDVIDGKAVSMWVPVGNLVYSVWDTDAPWSDSDFIELYSGTWSCEVPLPQKDIGWSEQVDCPVGQLDRADVTVKEIYLSPMNLMVILGRDGEAFLDDDEEWHWVDVLNADGVTLKDKDGNLVPLGPSYLSSGSIGNEESHKMFPLSEVTDPARLQGGSITLEMRCGTVTIPLDDLAPVAP